MRRIVRYPTLILAALAIAVLSLGAIAGSVAVQPGGKLWLEGTSTIHDYKSTAATFTATFKQDETLWPADAVGADALERFIRAKGISSLEVVVEVAGLKSGKDGLDKKMYEVLLAPAHPEILFQMAGYEIADGKESGEFVIDATGKLTVAGVEREIKVPMTAVRAGEGLRIHGSVPLLMSQFGIKPPKMMLGTIKTADKVVVHFDLIVAAPAADTTSSAE